MKTLIKSKMNRLFVAVVLMVSIVACETDLNIVNPNEPTPEVVQQEEGLKRLARGVYANGGGFLEWIIWQYHEHMGDMAVAPWVNYNFLYTYGNVEMIVYNNTNDTSRVAANSTTGFTQPQYIEFLNDRQDPNGGALQYEWRIFYAINNEMNLIFETLDGGNVQFTGDGEKKQNAYRAWAHFWKGYSYSRIGLMYEEGLINDVYGETNSNYVDNSEVIAESNRQLDQALTFVSDFDIIASDVVPEIFPTQLTAASLEATIYTLKARNFLMSKERSQMTSADWQNVRDNALNGLMTNDAAPTVETDDATFLAVVTFPWRMANYWSQPSARVVEAAIENPHGNDARAGRFLDLGDNQFSSFINSNNYVHLNTPYFALPPYASTVPQEAPLYFASAEENLLALAEAELALGDPAAAAGYIEDVWALDEQAAGIGAGTIGNATIADIRRERRIGLFTKGLGFYDMRRFGEYKPKAEGGGVKDVWIYHLVDTDNNPNTPNSITRATDGEIYYNYTPYWPVPVHETTFNPPGGMDTGAAKMAQ